MIVINPPVHDSLQWIEGITWRVVLFGRNQSQFPDNLITLDEFVSFWCCFRWFYHSCPFEPTIHPSALQHVKPVWSHKGMVTSKMKRLEKSQKKEILERNIVLFTQLQMQIRILHTNDMMPVYGTFMVNMKAFFQPT